MHNEEHFSKGAFLLQDLLENKNGRHPDCVAAIKKYGTIKEGKWLYIDRDKIPAICGHFNPLKGKDCKDCNKNREPPKDQLKEDLEKEGIQWGDAIAWVAKKLGIPECANCAVRHEIFNHVKQNGWLATIKALKETL